MIMSFMYCDICVAALLFVTLETCWRCAYQFIHFGFSASFCFQIRTLRGLDGLGRI